ncbi:MAG: TRAP transporter small permease [Proteobacteria bacterium]|nr:TRAP transporter small permease [Pseudomonadota bacterium]
MTGFERFSHRINEYLLYLGGLCLVGMVALTCANIGLRLIWRPISGTFELMGFLGAVVTAFALGYTQIKKGHIAVDVLIDTFSPKTRRGLSLVNGLLSLAFAILCAWQMAVKSWTLQVTGEVTETLRIIYHPFTYGAALGLALLGLVFLADVVGFLAAGGKED